MVLCDHGLPEPTDPESSLSTNNDIILAAETDSDDDESHYDGYERLPMNPTEVEGSGDDEESDNEDEVTTEGTSGLPAIVPVEEELVQEVWSSPPVKDIEMDPDKVNQVKEAMLNFTLPPGNIPDWANTIPEEQWKEHILKRLEKD